MTPRRFSRVHGTLAERQSIAKRFKAYRDKTGLTQEQLSSLMGLGGRASVCDIERARHLPHHSTLRKFVELERKGGSHLENAKF